ncbi:MAG: DEAD/DEAH box helicase, partial [Treponema sp.]|nr:DEAD/DEAH box helicase [Treponema sp.]
MNTAGGALTFKPGALVRLRNREWVVESSEPELLRVRPLGGSADDIEAVIPALETEPVEEASFPYPDIGQSGPFHSCLLLKDSLLMKSRAGAGPFRSFGGIAVEPRAYQLVPLLMALKQKTIRLLIADDVGVGKTIEASLIVREMLDRGEIERFAVLCPPHLVEQWVTELKTRFHLDARAVTASNVNRLERNVPHGLNLFQYWPFFVISLDYIKSDAHKNFFLANAPEMVLVDEAHTCTSGSVKKQRRFELLKALSEDENRHLVMLTATPHSGKEKEFYNLLSLLRKDFANLAVGENKDLRAELGDYFVQRRRVDIDEWKDASLFPRRKTKEVTYKLSGAWETFFEKVRSYCLELAQSAEMKHSRENHVIWYAILALLRCVSSSPAAARSALTTHLRGSEEELDALIDDDKINDDVGDDTNINDSEPAAALEKNSAFIQSLIDETKTLRGAGNDPKLALLIKELDALVSASPRFKPVVFCRYIATANYVAEELREHYKQNDNIRVSCVTGEISSEEREEKVDALIEEADIPILIATDCLSEGINLQHGFDAVLHYDLAWNPARHEQREGRVDRFGQKSGEVRCVMLYGENNPVDGLIFNVIIRKAQVIKTTLGILVPIPEDERKIQTAIVRAALMRKTPARETQGMLDFGGEDDEKTLETLSAEWQEASEKEQKNRTIFAQRSLKPEQVLPEWQKQTAALGGSGDVSRFVQDALQIAGSPLSPIRNTAYRLIPNPLPEVLRERIKEAGYEKPFRLDFEYPPEKQAEFLHRSHPVVSLLADYVLESALETKSVAETPNINLAARCGVYEMGAVNVATTLCLLRIRHKIEIKRGKTVKNILAEEALLAGFEGRAAAVRIAADRLAALLQETPSGNLSKPVIDRELRRSLNWFKSSGNIFDAIAREKSAALLADHRRV